VHDGIQNCPVAELSSVQVKLAPIALFVYKRPAHLRRALKALAACRLIEQSTLIVFSDEAKHGASDEDVRAVAQVRQIVRQIDFCKQLVVHERAVNFGFQNQIEGITEVLKDEGRVIVLEDDLVVAPAFLEYMNQALETYRDDDDVMHVSGYMLPIDCELPDTVFYNAATCWGWGTWQRAWKHFRDAPEEQLRAVASHPRRDAFDCPPYSYLNQLRDNVAGKVRTWDGMWHASIFLRGGLSLHPGRSLVQNMGHDGTGENCVPSNQFDTAANERSLKVERIPKHEWPTIRQGIARHYGIHSPGLLARCRNWLLRHLKVRLRAFFEKMFPELGRLRKNPICDVVAESTVDGQSRLYSPYRFEQSSLGAYSYIAEDSVVKNTSIGKFVSIGPGFRCGFGIHPVDTVSTSPVFYSVHKQTGETLSRNNKVVESKPVLIGNDVYIGMRVTILDGVSIADGAVIGAGAVVTHDIPAYAIAVGVPAKVVRYRFEPPVIARLLASRWWEGPIETLSRVERNVLDVEAFLREHEASADVRGPR
jgi:acetyltransferase-like isoleucine patch superfamily enzyme